MRLTKEKQGQSIQMQKAFQKETLSFRELSFRKKIEYIWDYYKWWIIGVVAVIAVICYTVPAVIEANKEVVLYTACINSNIVSQENTSLMDDFVAYDHLDLDNKKIILDTSMYINRGVPDNFAVESSQKLFALISTNTIDALLLDKENFDFYVKQGLFTDLSTLLTQEQLDRYKPLLIYGTTEADLTEKPYAVNTTSSTVLKNQKAYITDNYFTIPANAQKAQTAVEFLEYLMSQN